MCVWDVREVKKTVSDSAPARSAVRKLVDRGERVDTEAVIAPSTSATFRKGI